MSNSNKPLNSNDPYNRNGSRHTRNETGGKGKVAVIAVSALVVAGIAAAALYLVDVDQTQEARLPDVDVKVAEGQLPKFDVDVATVEMGTKDVEVEVPTVGVETETKTIEIEVPVDVDVDAGTTTETIKVPTLDVTRPKEDDPANNPNR
ncbi:hypothetical protein GCM10011309_20110 [Litorimonas cladophorae]|uniref:Uncharacterized protein n=1 Tax=Litorimonas cladophorae TaxID=1220491 RepID=A0A918NH46_9PROT|nr:hypothetical protein [Litorimonas cladophorae]GGX70053.1 hypothetical protein GCM10011309_20110 [Litorimonas cladophorae]